MNRPVPLDEAIAAQPSRDAPPPAGPDDYGVNSIADEPETKALLPIVSAASLAGKDVPSRSWHVRDMVPGRTITMLGGDGGVGKSLLAMQLGVATTAGKPWFGTAPEQGPVVILSAEDDVDEQHRQLAAITDSCGVDLADIGDLHLIPLAGRDAVLGAPEGKVEIIRATPVWRGLAAIVERIKPRLVVLDTLADVFAGNENARAEARQFIGLLRCLTIDHDLAILLLAHPSLSGMASGSGTSGSTAWSNSVRSRLYLETLKGDDGREIDADLRVLRVMKSNYGRTGLELRLRWSRGCFMLDGPSSAGGFDKLAADARADRVFLDLLTSFTAQSRDVSSKVSASYAPTVFAKHPSAEGVAKRAFADAMERLLTAKRIRVEPVGPPSRRTTRLAIVEQPSSEA